MFRGRARRPRPFSFVIPPHDPEKMIREFHEKEQERKEMLCSEIFTWLSIGQLVVACDKDFLKKNGFTAIVNVTTSDNKFPDSFEYFQVPIKDVWGENIQDYFEEAANFIEEQKKKGGKVLVHCQAGISRSPTIVIAYMMLKQGMTYNEAYEYVRSKRKYIDPNIEFDAHLRTLDKELKTLKEELNTLH